MDVLLVESRDELGLLWHRHLERAGITVHRARTQFAATDLISKRPFDVIVLDLVLEEGSALAVADFASYRQTDCRVIFVTNTSFFSDGSIFNLCANACAFLPAATKPEDLAAMVEHYGSR
ncbi:hypothetical protein [Litorisediminicola beolgyonensis]|uniref:Response regulatory domain-containing protein n=1 Tax=Litorisediminicola beolgyonensis TaxID=1173614 RepID=A0ABW3ZDI5_9RHOB